MSMQGKSEIDALLAGSLKELSAHKAIEKITIKEITDKAGVIRPTFYNHFQDKYELLEWIVTSELLRPAMALLVNKRTVEGMALMLSTIERDKTFYTKAAKMDGVITFDSIVRKCIQKELLANVKLDGEALHSVHVWLTTDLVATYYAESMAFAMISWILSGMQIPPQEVAEGYMYLLTHSMDEMIKDDFEGY